MRKIFALMLAALMLLGTTEALAEQATTENAVEVAPVENGVAVPFEDYNFQIMLPGDWNMLEVSDEDAQTGVIYKCANPESTRALTIAYTELDEATDMAGVEAELAAVYENVQALTINDISFVSYDIAEQDVTGIVTLGGSGVGLYQFVFYPASDADYGPLALQIAASITSIE